ncbi:hypothetical protein ACTFIW_004470 [Dictyostelium discoideum]
MNNELLFWKVFKNKYLLNYILKNKCCYKSKKFKTITSIPSMLKHKQYQLLICKLKANENLNFKSTHKTDKIINEIKDIEVLKEIYSLLLFKGYRDDNRGEVEILFDRVWGIKSVDLFDIHLKYHPEELQSYISTSIESIIQHNHPKLLIKVLNFILRNSINKDKPFTLTKNERNYFIAICLDLCKDMYSIEEIKEKIEMISNIPISPTSSMFPDSKILEFSMSMCKSVNVGFYLKLQKSIPSEFNNIQTFFDCSENSIKNSVTSRKYKNDTHSVYSDNYWLYLSMVSKFCNGFDQCISYYLQYVKGEAEYISSSIDSVLLYFKLYYCNYHVNSKSKSIPTSVGTQIDLIIQNNELTVQQRIKQLFQLLINETKSIVLYACYLKEYNEPIDTIKLTKRVQILLAYYMTKTYNINILNFLLKKDLKLIFTKSFLEKIGESYLHVLFKSNQFDKDNIILFYKIYTPQKSIIIYDLDEKSPDDIISTNEPIDLCNKQLHLILGKESSSKWKEITSNLIDNDMIVTIKDKETIDWLSDIETGGCSNLKIRNALNSKLKQMKLDFSTSELLEYARIKFKQVIPILDSNKKFCNIHILRTHDDIVSLINRLNESNFNCDFKIYLYYMIQMIQFGSKNSIKYLLLICDSCDEFYSDSDAPEVFNPRLEYFYNNSEYEDIMDDSAGYHENEDFNKYKIPTQQTCQIINLSKIKVNVNHFPNTTSYLLKIFIEHLNFEGVQFIIDNLNGNDLELKKEAFKDGFDDRIYSFNYLYKDLIDMIQFLIDKFKDGQLSLPNLSIILNFLFLKLIRVNNLTIDQIKTARQLISNYIEIDSSKHNSYYYLKTLSPIIGECITITIIEDPTTSLNFYDIDTSVYTFEHIFTNRNNNDLNQFIDSTIMDIVKDSFSRYTEKSKIYLDNNNPRINLFLHYFEIELEYRMRNNHKEPFLNYKLLKLIIKTFNLESFIKLDNLLEQYENYLRENGYHFGNLKIKEKSVSINMVQWFGTIIYKDYSDYQGIINYLFNKYEHQLYPYIIYFKYKLNKTKKL